MGRTNERHMKKRRNLFYKSKRNKEILLMFEAGQTLKELAWTYEISTSRVRQVINKERHLLIRSMTHCEKCGQKLE